ncbi:MAG: hypothetical protein OHK006_00200 [Thermodesulfovibrionales bacterium]
MKKVFAAAAFALLIGLPLAGCAKPAAIVNTKQITRKALDLRVREAAADLRKKQQAALSEEELRQRVLRRMIDERLILDEAARLGITVSDQELDAELSAFRHSLGEEGYRRMIEEAGMSEAAFRGRTREKLLLAKFVRSLVDPSAVTDDELIAEYQGSQRPFIKSGQVLMRLIEVPDEAKARALAAEIRAKQAEFDVIAERAKKSDPTVSAASGWTNPDFFQPPISDAMKELKIGQSGGPYRGTKGWFLIRIDDRRKEEIASFAEMKEKLRNTLLERKRQTALAHWLDSARSQASIQTAAQEGGS